jgi:glycosyltransferase involved in cell wall biosynthesis
MTAGWARGRRVVMLTLDVAVDPRVEREAHALTEEGFEVVVIAPAGEPMWESQVEIDRVPIGRGLLQRVRRRARTALLAARGVDMTGFEHHFYSRALVHRPDVVHVQELPLLRAGVALRRATGAKLVYDIRDWYPEAPRVAGPQRQELRSIERRHITAADARITVNSRLAEAISRAYGVEVGTLSLAFDPPPELHDREHDLFRSELGIPDDARIALYQGWLAPERNLEHLVDAIALANSTVELVLMGYGEHAEELLRRAVARGVAGRVHLAAARPRYDFLRWTASADVGVIPYPAGRDLNSRLSSPNKLYEYIAARLPILANDLPFVRGVVEQNDFGVVDELESAEDFAQALDAFPHERRHEFRRNMAARGEEFTWRRERRKLLELYRTLLAVSR